MSRNSSLCYKKSNKETEREIANIKAGIPNPKGKRKYALLAEKRYPLLYE